MSVGGGGERARRRDLSADAAAIGLLSDAIWNHVAGVTGSPRAASATPPTTVSTVASPRPSGRSTAHVTPATPCASRSCDIIGLQMRLRQAGFVFVNSVNLIGLRMFGNLIGIRMLGTYRTVAVGIPMLRVNFVYFVASCRIYKIYLDIPVWFFKFFSAIVSYVNLSDYK